MEFGQLIKYNERNFLFKNHAENKAGIPVLDLFLLFNKALYKIKVSVNTLVLICFGRPRPGHTIKTSF